MRKMLMKNLGKNNLNVALTTAFIIVAFFLAGCGDNEMAKGITDVVKKSVEGEVAKKGEEIKKQVDRVINLGTGKGQKEDEKGAAAASTEEIGKGSDKESEEED
jgi:hypothetical protein